MKKDLSLPFTKPKVSICGDKSVNCIYSEKTSFISIQSEITWLQLLKRWIRVLSCNLQREHKGEGDFPKQNSILLRYNTWLSILYWEALKFVLLLISLGRRYIIFQSKLESENKELKYCCEVRMLGFLDVNIEYNSFEVNFSNWEVNYF